MSKPKVLLVDDEPDITAVLKLGLERYNFDVVTYNDPTKALADYKPNDFDFHVLDIRMPGISGYQLARQIWLIDPSAEICFLSAYETYQEAKAVFQDANAQCFLTKPVTASFLASHLKSHSEGSG